MIFLIVITISGIVFLAYQKGLGGSYVALHSRELVKVFLYEGMFEQRKITSNSRLITAYAKLALFPIVFSPKQINTLSLLDYKITFFNYNDLQQIFSEIFIQNYYYFSTTNNKPYIIDCGSNIGLSIMYFKKLFPEAQIIGFEPSAVCFDVLKKNIADNNLSGITLYKKALSNKNGDCLFSASPGSLGSSMISVDDKQSGKNIQQVECVRLSGFINQPVNFLKMDIEGAELLVLEELDRAHKLSLIKEMVIEYHHHFSAHDDLLSSFLAMLEKNNFGYQIRKGGNWHSFGKEAVQGIIIYAYSKNK